MIKPKSKNLRTVAISPEAYDKLKLYCKSIGRKIRGTLSSIIIEKINSEAVRTK